MNEEIPIAPPARRCPVCAQGPVELQWRRVVPRTRWRIYRCTQCGVQMAWPQPTPSDLAALYSADYYKAWGMESGETTELARMKKATFDRRMRELLAFVRPGRLLDVGTASGFLLEVAREQGWDVHGVELSAYSGNLAAGKFGGARIHIGTLATAPFAKGSFRAVIMSDLLEHVTDPIGTLREAAAMLQPGGVVMVTSPNTNTVAAKVMGSRWTHYHREHLFFFDRHSMRVAASRAGLELASFALAKKTFTLRYLYTQFTNYPHPLLTPMVRAMHAVLRPVAIRPFVLSTGDFVAVLRKPT